jgi:hypothetical protein
MRKLKIRIPQTAFRKVYNGELLIDEDFESIRTRVRARDMEPVTA